MAKSKKPRKPYNPNKTYTDSPFIALARYSKKEGDSLKFRIYFHLYRLTTDDCDAGDYLALEFRLKIGLGLSNIFIEDEIKDKINNGLKLLSIVKHNRMTTGSWKINSEVENKLRSVLALVDDIQDHTTRREQLPVFVNAEKQIDHSLRDTLP